MKRKQKILGMVGIAVLLLVFLAGGFVMGKVTSGKINIKFNADIYKATALPDLFNNTLTQQIWSILKSDFVDQTKLQDKEMFYSALRGLVAGVGDPYTTFLDPQTSQEFDAQIAGEFQGIGAEIAIKDGVLTIVAPMTDSPAWRAGLLAGDKVLSIDGKDTIGLSLEESARRIRGPKDTKVTLLIVRGDDAPQEFVITREVIIIKSVRWEFRPDNIVYLQLSSFNEDLAAALKKFQGETQGKEIRGIILDLRNNPGGLLNAGLDAASLWVNKNVLMIEKFGDGREVNYQSGKGAPFKNIPTVVLINQGSASASEIVAGALQDYKLATLVGKKSFGKGSVQALRKLPDGSSLKVTIAKWLTPKGHSIDDAGITPDVEVNFTAEQYTKKLDPQLDKALAILKK